MKYYSTNNKSAEVSLREAVVKGLAPDRGLYMPQRIERLDNQFYETIDQLSLQEIARVVSSSFFSEDIDQESLDFITNDTLNFPIPLVEVEPNIYVLELFHGPTFAFKDVGARFMARMLSHFVQTEKEEDINVLVATSGDTGSAVANGFLGVEGVKVYVLYPAGKVSDIQEAQFTTLGQNITAIEVDGTFDDCQRLVKSAFLDEELNKVMKLTSANSINVARFLPQSFYYFHAYAELKKRGVMDDFVFSVPSGNLGNLTAGLFAKRMGLPVKRFIAANNRNDVFSEYLKTGSYDPRSSVQTIANAMDVGDPSNFERIVDLYNHSHQAIAADVAGYRYSDEEIRKAISSVYDSTGYLLDPHGACGYMALKEDLKEGEQGVFLATAHPAKFKETVEESMGGTIEIPQGLQQFMHREKRVETCSADYENFKTLLLNT